MNLGNKIKELRLRSSITQEQLAGHLSVTPQCISKWENGLTMPDIQLLPEISVFFGVTIDELFDLTDAAYLERISNLIRNKRMLDESEFQWAKSFLKDKMKAGIQTAVCAALLADLYNHRADGCRTKAEQYAKEAIRLEPENKYHHSLLRMAQQGTLLDWNFSNHSRRIAYYQQFVKEHPTYERGYIMLLDELLADQRLAEAEFALTQMKSHCGSSRVLLYRGLIQWQKGEHEKAQNSWNEMVESYPNDWLIHSLMGDCMARTCRYEEAIQYYRKAMELQEKPHYTDSSIAIAHIYEIQGNTLKAIEAWQNVLQILQEDYGLTEGEGIDAPLREIKRLQAGIAAKKQ